MIHNVTLNKSEIETNYINRITGGVNILANLPQNIDIFSELQNISNEVNETAKKSYYRLLYTIKKYLNEIDRFSFVENNLAKLRSFVDEEQDIMLEWIIRNNFRIGFSIDKQGNISFWKIYKNDTITNTISDTIEEKNFDEKIVNLINEVIYLT